MVLADAALVQYRNYTVMMVNAPGADQIAERSGEMRQQVLDQSTLSRSL